MYAVAKTKETLAHAVSASLEELILQGEFSHLIPTAASVPQGLCEGQYLSAPPL
jgi:hypothetical protein